MNEKQQKTKNKKETQKKSDEKTDDPEKTQNCRSRIKREKVKTTKKPIDKTKKPKQKIEQNQRRNIKCTQIIKNIFKIKIPNSNLDTPTKQNHKIQIQKNKTKRR